MKKLLKVVLTVLFFIPFVVFADDKEKVKVYVFESGGCPYCEAEREYLEGLESYNKKFVIISKELYVDHVDWEPGKDYELGKLVAETFKEQGFENAAYTGTPFVVISDVYAAATYSTDLEKYIDKAYEEGDKDAVSCIDKGNENCVRYNEEASKKKEENEPKGGVAVLILGVVALVGVIVYTFMNKNKKVNKEEDEGEVKPAKKTTDKKSAKTETKKTTTKKQPAKKTAKKTTTKKTTKKK